MIPLNVFIREILRKNKIRIIDIANKTDAHRQFVRINLKRDFLGNVKTLMDWSIALKIDFTPAITAYLAQHGVESDTDAKFAKLSAELAELTEKYENLQSQPKKKGKKISKNDILDINI
jgi:hypothetical protein